MVATDQRTINAQQRRLKALELRRTGRTYSQIASQLGMARSSVHKTIGKALDQLRQEQHDSALELQTQEADRLDHLQSGLWDSAIEGDVYAVDRVLRIMERRARLLGLDQPAKVAPTSPDGSAPYSPAAMTDDERRARIDELERRRHGTESAGGE